MIFVSVHNLGETWVTTWPKGIVPGYAIVYSKSLLGSMSVPVGKRNFLEKRHMTSINRVVLCGE